MQEKYAEYCQRMASPLMAQGFLPRYNGNLWNMESSNGDTEYEVFFEPKQNEQTMELEVVPHFFVMSKKVLDWQRDDMELGEPMGMVWGTQLAFVSEKNDYYEWSLAEGDVDASINEIIELFESHILPICKIFDNTEEAVKHFAEKGGEFYNYMDISLTATSYMLINGTTEQTSSYIQKSLPRCPQKDQIVDLFNSLPRMQNVDLNTAEFHAANSVKLAFVNGVRL